MRVNGKGRTVLVGILAGVALVAGACGGSGSDRDRAGGAQEVEPHVLTMAQPNDGEPPAQLVSWAEAVKERSGGTVTIEFRNGWRLGEADYESGTIEDVRVGKVDLGWVGARAFDTVGVNSFQALLAPLLVDNHDLQAAVFEAGIPQEMLQGLEEIDLVGIGVLPGPMRKLLGISEPLVKPADFVGKTIGLQDSALAADTLTALGATPKPVPSSAELVGLDGYEQQLASIAGNRYYTEAGYVTANVNLWPRPLVIVMGSGPFERLAPQQQNALREAAAEAIPAALEDSRAEDDEAVPLLCSGGMTLAVATESDLAEFRGALQPVYEGLNADPATKARIDAIQGLKNTLGVAPEVPQCAAGDAAGSSNEGVTFPQGRFESTLTADDWVGLEDQGVTVGTFAMVIDAETLTIVDPGSDEPGFKGTYSVFRDTIEVTDGVDKVTARWSFAGERLSFTEVTPENSPFEVVWESHPWQKVS
jgi:TRAP-type C4-dicarboxylate transport system substrate-binding protein